MIITIILNLVYIALLYIISTEIAKKLKCDGIIKGIVCVMFADEIVSIISRIVVVIRNINSVNGEYATNLLTSIPMPIYSRINGIIGNIGMPHGIINIALNLVYLIAIVVLIVMIGKNKATDN